MLVLSRLEGESIVIGGSVTVRVADVQGKKVWLAIDAPPETLVDREEIHLRRVAELAAPNLNQEGTDAS